LLDKAVADLDQANALDPKNAYSALWLDIAAKRSGLPARLPQAASQVDMTKWPAPLIQLLMGQAQRCAYATLGAALRRPFGLVPVIIRHV
jgi:hypothetical protein